MSLRPVAFGLLVGLAAAGCDSGPKVVKVSGVATFQGKPVPNIRLTFTPEKGRPSWGDTDASGRFTLDYDEKNKGAIVGWHVVSARVQDPGGVIDYKPSPLAKQVADKYGEGSKTPLKIEITTANENLEVKFD